MSEKKHALEDFAITFPNATEAWQWAGMLGMGRGIADYAEKLNIPLPYSLEDLRKISKEILKTEENDDGLLTWAGKVEKKLRRIERKGLMLETEYRKIFESRQKIVDLFRGRMLKEHLPSEEDIKDLLDSAGFPTGPWTIEQLEHAFSFGCSYPGIREIGLKALKDLKEKTEDPQEEISDGGLVLKPAYCIIAVKTSLPEDAFVDLQNRVGYQIEKTWGYLLEGVEISFVNKISVPVKNISLFRLWYEGTLTLSPVIDANEKGEIVPHSIKISAAKNGYPIVHIKYGPDPNAQFKRANYSGSLRVPTPEELNKAVAEFRRQA